MPTSDLTSQVAALLDWYQQSAEPFLREHQLGRLEQLQRDSGRLRTLVGKLERELPICFLGQAGIGKSTLVNSVVAGAETVLPQGGVGPLTAQATSVSYANQPSFEAEYHPPLQLSRLVAGLEMHWEAEQRAVGKATQGGTEELEQSPESSTSGDPDGSRVPEYKKQARLLIQGSPFGDIDLPYLMDSLRFALGQKRRWGTTSRVEDDARVERIRSALELSKSKGTYLRQGAAEDTAFFAELRDHSSGFLAPLIRKLRVCWDAPVLKSGLVLVDLPGVGVANDVYREITNRYVGDEARAVVLVVDRAGITEASAQLLRDSRFFLRLLSAADDPTVDPVALMVAVVKLDEPTDDAWDLEKREKGKAARRWNDHFDTICDGMSKVIRAQLKDQLDAMVASSGQSFREERQAVVDRVLETVEIHPVSAKQYRLFLANDDEDKPKIRHASQSRIPGLAQRLALVAQERRDSQAYTLWQETLAFRQQVQQLLEITRAAWTEDGRAHEEAEKLNAELSMLLPTLQQELAARRGAFRHFLRESLPESIDTKVALASAAAKEDIEKYLLKLGDVPWQTLRAAVRRGGAFNGARHIDLTTHFAVRFEEPTALVWSRDVLVSLRKNTSALAMDFVKLVDVIVDWAKAQGTKVQPKMIELQREQIQADATMLKLVGKDAVDDLRDRVRKQLMAKIEAPIRQRCEKFVKGNLDRGAGVKARMLDLCQDLVPDVVLAAQEVATSILKTNFHTVELEIREVFDRYPNPLTSAAEALVSSHEERLRKSDAARRGPIIAEVANLLASVPPLTPEKREAA